MQTDVDAVVIGAGVVGLACAVELAAAGLTTCLLERHARPGLETSTHNSGVVHAGIYYPTGTLKATLCVEGKRLLYDFCARHDVPHRRCGKLVVGSSESDTAVLEALYARALANDVEDMEMVDADFVRRKEPHVRPVAALWSGSSGILEAEALVRALKRECNRREVMLVAGHGAVRGDSSGETLMVETGSEPFGRRSNCAGLSGRRLGDVRRGSGSQSILVEASMRS